MSDDLATPFELRPDDPILEKLSFKPYRNAMLRRVVPFLPQPDEPQTCEVKTPWGSVLTAKKGDMLISELDAPQYVWPIDAGIFDETYMMTGPGVCIKRAVTWIVPLEDVVGGDVERMVTVYTLEGPETVRAGDFFLAKGGRGEIWPYLKEKVAKTMRPAE
ncbi:MAG: hypothetical protein HXY38_07205 [Chloroflexi bacterium]|nr:hypothetical protein [Chloroflexota bacterium]